MNERSAAGRGAGLALATLLLLPAIAWLTTLRLQPPPPLGADAPAQRFSAGRAMAHVEALARRPRPVGSAANEVARRYLVERLAALGLEAEVQEAVVLRDHPAVRFTGARVRNVMARLPGSGGGGKAVLLLSHYDSVASGPGAADDASGVAAVLETLRALRAGPALVNDVIALFTDGEEPGLLGARAFVEEHPWAADAGVVLNLEARGSSGPSIMFRTSPGNGRLARAFAAASPAPAGNSLSQAVFRYMPNDTDFSVFDEAGIPGMDFAFIGNHPAYHSALDTPENLDPGSLQHHGEHLLALIRHLGAAALVDAAAPDAIYFDLLRSVLVVYPMGWAWPLTLLAALAYIALAVFALRRGVVSPGRWLGAVAGFLISAALGVLLAAFALQQARGWDTAFAWMPRGVSYQQDLYALALLLLAGALATTILVPLLRGLGAANLGLGALGVWLLALVAATLWLPGATYLFLWPLLGGTGALALVLPLERDPVPPSWGRWLALTACALPALVLVPPLTALLVDALGLPMAPGLFLLPLLTLGLLVPHLAVVMAWRRWLVPALCWIAGLGLFVLALTRGGFDARHPRPESLFYCLNHGSGEALWASADPRPGPWASTVLGAEPYRDPLDGCAMFAGPRGFWSAPAPAAELAPPVAELVEDEVDEAGEGRRLKILLRSPRGAAGLRVGLESLGQVEWVKVGGRPRDLADRPFASPTGRGWLLLFHGVPAEGLELELRLNAVHPVEITVTDQSYGLPVLTGGGVPPRPADTMARPFFPLGDSTLVWASYLY